MVKQVGETEKFALDWGRRNRKIALLRDREQRESRVVSVTDSPKKKRL